ncbi:ERI1 exoribonuclease 2-like isoform X2 [Triticum urartu]|uniref:ERI1 exoribonuclease 2-like isoform X2 n=1 Tax=Triticum urartu TaxID=4572 RepID=UPI0020436589|nr:ERI1 exoribonuclease 2-like isoform X2 [Triticum urartu]
MAARGQGLEQEFDFFVVVDFEATCVKDGRIFPQEIIEFPAVLVDGATGRIESAFRRYVRPKHHPVLTEFCRELTGIRQEDVDGGVELGDALWLHDSWLKAATAGAGNKRGVRLAVVTWGDWDCQTILEFECRFKGIEKPSYFDRWINLRVPFQAALGGGGRVNLQEAVRAAGLDWEGRLHCGLDDALNTARLLAEIMRRGVKITITGSLAPPPPIQQKQQPGASPCGGSPALAPPPIQQQPPRTGPCSGTFALVPAPAPIQQKQQPPQPHIIRLGFRIQCLSAASVDRPSHQNQSVAQLILLYS